MRIIRALIHILIVSVLTITTQVGGVIWILVFGIFKLRKDKVSILKRLTAFLGLYLIFTFFIIPPCAIAFGRTPLPMTKSSSLVPHNYITPLLNRQYVTVHLKSELQAVANLINTKNTNLKLSYLDANFPFIDGFPLLPHRSHDDGRKVDLSFYYTKNEKASNSKPSISGYGSYESPTTKEWDQNKYCKDAGHWQYDFPKYLTLGSRSDLEFDQERTRDLIIHLLNQPKVHKIFIEPHLKTRLNLKNDRIRFHGCAAVRHDDHIHYQILK